MALDRVLTAFLHEPWGIRPEAHHALGAVLARHLAGEPLPAGEELRQRNPMEGRNAEWKPCGDVVVGPVDGESGEPLIPQMQKLGSMAVIPVFGTLGRHLSFLALWCGGCDYSHVEQMVQLAEADPNIETVVFYFRSPGGMVLGCEECVQVIAGMSKESIAYSDDMCTSCAYWMAAACDQIVFSPSAIVGNVGVFISGRDDSEMWKNAGMKRELFRSGPLKAAGIDGKPWTEAERASYQARVDESFAAFAGFLAEKRPGMAAEILDGAWFAGREGHGLGLCDAIVPSFEAFLAQVMAS